jgi:hypothetical protein
VLGLLLRLPYFAIYETESRAMRDDNILRGTAWMLSVVSVALLL